MIRANVSKSAVLAFMLLNSSYDIHDKVFSKIFFQTDDRFLKFYYLFDNLEKCESSNGGTGYLFPIFSLLSKKLEVKPK